MADTTEDNLTTLKHDAADTVDEAKNRTQAAGEHLKRDVSGNAMPLGERIVSNVKEALHNTVADIDRAKRDVRHGAADTKEV